VLDNRHSSALARALGATPREVSAITGGDSDRATLPSPWQLLAVVLATVLVVAALTAVPARLGGRRPVTETLDAELA
jgi:hypothetical protein